MTIRRIFCLVFSTVEISLLLKRRCYCPSLVFSTLLLYRLRILFNLFVMAAQMDDLVTFNKILIKI